MRDEPEYTFVKGEGWVICKRVTRRVIMRDGTLVEIELRHPNLGEYYIWSGYNLHEASIEEWAAWTAQSKFEDLFHRAGNGYHNFKNQTYCVFTKLEP